MQSIKFIRENGNIPKSLPGQDHISGLIAYVENVPHGFARDNIQPCSSLERAEGLGIVPWVGKVGWDIRVLHYQLSEIFRLNPGVTLWVGIYPKPSSGKYTFSEIKAMQNYTGGALRQIGVWCGHKDLTGGDLTALQGVADDLTYRDRPLSIGYAPRISDVTTLSQYLAGSNRSNVSVIIGQDGGEDVHRLYTGKGENDDNRYSVTAIGHWLGVVSRAGVHQAISAVRHFPTGIEVPAFGDGTLLRNLDTALVEALDEARYLFFVTYDGIGGTFFNDSHTMDDPASDYAHIENVRTMDKAVRGIRRALLPELGGALYVDEATGQLTVPTIEYLTLVANGPLDEMKRAGEISGMRVEIDPDQNVLATSTVEFVIKQVGVGVLRRIECKIGFVQSLNQ